MTLKVTSSRKMDNKPQKGEYLEVLLRSPKTVFSTKDAALLWGEENETTVSARLNKYIKAGKLFRIRRGLYAKDANYNKRELATRIFTPSYISFETVLNQEGINFQFYGQIFVASYLKREITVGNQIYSYKKIKDTILTNPFGIENKDNCSIATKERAFLDTLYINKDYHFDNLGSLDWTKVFEMLPIYNNKRMNKKVKEFYEHFNATK